jgi:hypothetical protein
MRRNLSERNALCKMAFDIMSDTKEIEMEEHVSRSHAYAKHEIAAPPCWCWNVIWAGFGFMAACLILLLILPR